MGGGRTLFWWGLGLAAVLLGRFFWPPLIRVAVDYLGADPGLFFALGWAPTGLCLIVLAVAPPGEEATRRRPWTLVWGPCAAVMLLQLGMLRLPGSRLTGEYADALLACVLGLAAAWAVIFTVLPACYLAARLIIGRGGGSGPSLAAVRGSRLCRSGLAVGELVALVVLLPWADRIVAGWQS